MSQICCGAPNAPNTCQAGLLCQGVGTAQACVPMPPCGAEGQPCCGGNNGTCNAGLACDNPAGLNNSTCKNCGAIGGACCSGAVCQMGGLCIGAVNGMGGMCQHCGAMTERCCGGVNAPNTCVAGLTCQGQGTTQACLPAPPTGGMGQPCGPNATCNGNNLECVGAMGGRAGTCEACGGLNQRCCGNGGAAMQRCDVGMCLLRMGVFTCLMGGGGGGGGATPDAGP
jgi:hypothetical protein